MLFALLLLLGAASFIAASPFERIKPAAKSVQLPTGKYFGAHDEETGTTTYYAIPYAYASRFEPSKLIDTRSDLSPSTVVNASSHGAACINFAIPPPYNEGYAVLAGKQLVEPQSEDCLLLDVYVPDGDHEDLPVVHYTPGGGFLVGSSFTYDMKDMVSRSAAIGKPFIGVAINYRLGPLGFLNPSTWGNETNIGLLDQVNALRYVKKYISAFGGSPDKVTIMGESAGGESTMHQLLWTNEKLFRSAWLMSVPSSGQPFTATHSPYKDALVESYAKACGCKAKNIEDAVSCLAVTKTSTMVNNSIAWEGSMTSLNGGYIRGNVFDTIRAGDFPKVPAVFSICRDEATSEVIGFKSNNTQTTSIIIDQFVSGSGLKGQQASDFMRKMLEAYPNDPALGCPFDGLNTTYNQPSQFKRMAAIANDGTWAEPWSEYLETFSHKTDVWGLIFEQPIPGAKPAYGVQHGSDLAYYFPKLGGRESNPTLHGQQVLVHTIHDAIANFALLGDPNGCASQSSGYRWPRYSEARLVTALNSTQIATAVHPPHRPGFDVLHKFLRPGPFWNAAHQSDAHDNTAADVRYQG